MFNLFNRRKVADLEHEIGIQQGEINAYFNEVKELRHENKDLRKQVQRMYASLQRAIERNNELRDELRRYDDEAEKSRHIVQGTEYMKERVKETQQNSDYMRDRQYEKDCVARAEIKPGTNYMWPETPYMGD